MRGEIMAKIEGSAELMKRLVAIEKAMALIFAYTHDHKNTSDDQLTVQYLGIRLFNTAAASLKLGLSGYYQPALALARDIMETGFLIDFLRTSPEHISKWKAADEKERWKHYKPSKIREALDKRDGNKERKRGKVYGMLSEYASHATYTGFRMTSNQGSGEVGPFLDEVKLKAWLEEMVLRLGPVAIIFGRHFPDGHPNYARFRDDYGKELIELMHKNPP